MQFILHRAAVLAPGFGSLDDLRAAFRTGRPPEPGAGMVLPAPSALPANERRRASQAVRLALACIEQALQSCPFPAESLRAVFATDEGTGEVCGQMLEAVNTTRQVSPMVFPNSVQNAPSGYFSIAWRNQQAATVVSLGQESFASGLLCAAADTWSTGQPVLLVAYDPAMTEPLDELLPVREATACAWILRAHRPDESDTVDALASFELKLGPAGPAPSPHPGWLPPHWSRHSSARALAALGLLETPAGTAFHLSLGRQIVTLRRLDQVRP